MTRNKTILAVLDPTVKEQPAVDRAAWLAKALGASLELFICDYDQYLSGERFFDSKSLEKARKSLIDGHLSRLRSLQKQLTGQGIQVSADARWDHPLDQGIVRKVVDAQPLLVVKDTHYHAALKRTVFSNTDWNLIRACPAPLLLVKPRAIRAAPTVIAAVDPTHEHDKPAELDHAIMQFAKELATAVHGQLHVFHSFDPTPAIAGATDTLTTPISLPVRELTQAIEKHHREAMQEFLQGYAIEPQNEHIHQGPPQELLVKLAEQQGADFVVMGAVARGALKRVFLGSTAERVLDRLPCDLAIVKPAGFQAPT